jgi:hypothetical protein
MGSNQPSEDSPSGLVVKRDQSLSSDVVAGCSIFSRRDSGVPLLDGGLVMSAKRTPRVPSHAVLPPPPVTTRLFPQAGGAGAVGAAVPLPGMTERERERWLKHAFERDEASKLREALPEYFLDLGLDLYATFTYKERPTRNGKRVRPKGEWAKKCLHITIAQMNRAIWGKRWSKRKHGMFGVICWEKHKDGHPHAHALFGGLPPHIPVADMQQWFTDRLGWCVVKRIGPADRRVAQYVSKYITKDSSGDAWEFYGHLTGRTQLERYKLGSLFSEEE